MSLCAVELVRSISSDCFGLDGELRESCFGASLGQMQHLGDG